MLGLIIGPDRIKIGPKMVEVIMAWPVSTKVKEVQLFLGLASCCELSLMPLNILQAQYFQCYKTMANGIPVPIYQKGLTTQTRTMTSMIRK